MLDAGALPHSSVSGIHYWHIFNHLGATVDFRFAVNYFFSCPPCFSTVSFSVAALLAFIVNPAVFRFVKALANVDGVVLWVPSVSERLAGLLSSVFRCPF